MQIEMIVFSGRRNPSWRLSPETVHALEMAIRKLSRVSGPLEIPERLGYCGMVVSSGGQSQSWLKVIVYHEFIRVQHRARIDYLIDDDRIVENMLLQTATQHVDTAVIDSIRAEPAATEAS